MKKSHIFLLAAFALSFAAMVVTLQGMKNVTRQDIIVYVLFGLVGVFFILYVLRNPNSPHTPQFAKFGRAKYFVASWAIVGASWLAVSTVLFFFGTAEGFTVLEKAWFLPALLGLAAAITPLVKKHVK